MQSGFVKLKGIFSESDNLEVEIFIRQYSDTTFGVLQKNTFDLLIKLSTTNFQLIPRFDENSILIGSEELVSQTIGILSCVAKYSLPFG